MFFPKEKNYDDINEVRTAVTAILEPTANAVSLTSFHSMTKTVPPGFLVMVMPTTPCALPETR